MKLKIICVFALLYSILTFFPVHNLPPIEIKLDQVMRIVFEIKHFLFFNLFLILTLLIFKGSTFRKFSPVLGIPLILYSILGIFVSYANQGQTYEDIRVHCFNSKTQIIKQLFFQGVHGTESRLVVVEKDFKHFRIFKTVDEGECEK